VSIRDPPRAGKPAPAERFLVGHQRDCRVDINTAGCNVLLAIYCRKSGAAFVGGGDAEIDEGAVSGSFLKKRTKKLL
jgi:hypothetical protein